MKPPIMESRYHQTNEVSFLKFEIFCTVHQTRRDTFEIFLSVVLCNFHWCSQSMVRQRGIYVVLFC